MFTTNPLTPAYNPSQSLPQHLDHKPVYALPYEVFDGPYAGLGNTDIRFVSVGIAQYDAYSVSVKTMRYTGDRWTRQAEELPVHRPIDMTIFLAKVLFDSEEGVVTIPRGTLQNQASDIIVKAEQRSPGELASYQSYVATHGAALKDRLNALRTVLNDLKARGNI
jgi:hypothetical protein